MQEIIERIRAFENGHDRSFFLKNIKTAEQEFLDKVRIKSMKPWYCGLGIRISTLLMEFKDEVILAAVKQCGGMPPGITIAAVGGYGRGELSPGSDLDILLLYEDKAPIDSFAREFLYLLWDLGYPIGSSTRTLTNVKQQMKTDVTFLTAVFESRFIAGSIDLFQKLEKLVRKEIPLLRNSFLSEKTAELQAIRNSGGAEILRKEPDIKKSAGGLRTVHMMTWVNFAYTLRRGLQGLKEELGAMAYKRLFFHYDYLTHIRNVMHLETGRKSDILTIDRQLNVARSLCIKGMDSTAMKKLMRRYYEMASDIYLSAMRLLEKRNLDLKNGFFLKAFRKKMTGTPWLFCLDKTLYVEQGTPPDIEKALNTARLCVQGNFLPSWSLFHYLGLCRSLLTPEARSSRPVFNMFMDILKLDKSAEIIHLLKVSGFLYRLVPPLRFVRHMILHNPFHLYTVDQHSIEGVRVLDNIGSLPLDPLNRSRYLPVSKTAEVYASSIWILKLAVLLHDSGKAFDGDHSKNGVELARRYLSSTPLNYSYQNLILFLIDHHLLLSDLVRRKDIHHGTLQIDLAREFILSPFPREYLDLLYLFTFADISATDPAHFSGYISSLLYNLYSRTALIVSRPKDNATTENIIEESIRRVIELTRDSGISSFIKDMGINYCASNTAEEIVADYENAAASKDRAFTVLVRSYNDYFRVKLSCPDRNGLFSTLAGILTLCGADIVKASLYTWNGRALDDFIITGIHGTQFTEHSMKNELKSWIEDLENRLAELLDQPEKLDRMITSVRRRIPPIPAEFRQESKVSLRYPADGTGELELSGTDRPALLFDISHLLARKEIAIVSAVIDTSGWYVNDRFTLSIPSDITKEQINSMILELKTLLDR